MPEEQTPEQALAQLRDAELAWDLARLNLEEKLRDAFPEEQGAVQHAEAMVSRCKDALIEAIAAYGALPADAKSPVGWAHYSGANKREYAPLVEWKAALEAAGLQALRPLITTESLNIAGVEAMVKASGVFHAAVETLIKDHLSKPSLRYHWNPPAPEAQKE